MTFVNMRAHVHVHITNVHALYKCAKCGTLYACIHFENLSQTHYLKSVMRFGAVIRYNNYYGD